MGSLIGGLLSSKHEVTLVGRPGHVRAIRKRGLKIIGKIGIVAHVNAATKVPDEAQDLIIVATKAYDTTVAVKTLEKFWNNSLFLTLQNGLRNPDIIAAKAKRVMAGTTSHGVTFVKFGLVHHAGFGDTYIGTFKGTSQEEVEGICSEFTSCDFPAKYSEDVRRDLWLKVIVNAAINPITAIVKVPNGRLLEVPQLHALMLQSCEEGVRVARKEGHDISYEEAVKVVERVARRTAENKSSMLQDIENGRRTEVEEISGAIVKAGKKHGFALPTLDTIRLTVMVLERSRVKK